MPTFSEQTKPYEFLIRFNDNGDIGASYSTETKVFRDDVLFSSKIDNPVQLAVVEGEVGDMLTDILGASVVEVLNNNTALNDRNAELLAAGTQLNQQYQELTGKYDQLVADNSQLQGDYLSLTEQNNTLKADVERRTSQMDQDADTLTELRASLTEANEEITRKTAQMADAEVTFAGLNSTIADLEAELATLKQAQQEPVEPEVGEESAELPEDASEPAPEE